MVGICKKYRVVDWLSTLNSQLLSFTLLPAYLQLVFNLLDPVDAPQQLLGHLLLVERANGAFQSNKTIRGLNVELVGGQVRVPAKGTLDLREERTRSCHGLCFRF